MKSRSAMPSMAISAFKAHALEVVARVAESRQGVVVTKRGRPMALVMPYEPDVAAARPGRLREALVFEHDIVSPLGPGLWEAAQ